MVKNNSPWDNDTPWNSPDKPNTKIISIPKIKNKSNFDFNPVWIIAAIILLWLVTGFYQVQPNEQGVVLRFGKYVNSTTPGLNYHLPYPIETVEKVNITQERSINLGVNEAIDNTSKYRRSNSKGDIISNQLANFTESHMLTGDENIVDVNLTVVWKIKNAKDYLFSMQDPDNTVSVAAQSVLREIVGQSEMQPIITGDRGKVEDETKEELQKVMDEFGSGIEIVRVKLQKADPPKQVVDAFNEVQRAKADMERFKNEAEAYRNEILPKARGEAAQLLQNAQAYKEAVVNKAQGEADRFNSVYNAYNEGRNVTARRMYLETMEKVLSDSNKVIIDQKTNGNGVVPYLPLDKLK
ncbi:MAG: FtsH protease activity modulator HflK [Alphaproteobacteria bacterium]|nr:FtsH protease activity modulator HflK [Alphaproteobacteria bacterium]